MDHLVSQARDFPIMKTCPICRNSQTIMVREDDMRRWQRGAAHVQYAFPYLTSNEREALLSGICASCWNNMFPPEIEDED